MNDDIFRIDMEFSNIINDLESLQPLINPFFINDRNQSFVQLLQRYNTLPIFLPRRNALVPDNHQYEGSKLTTLRDINKASTVELAKKIKDTCSICLENYKPISILRTLLSCNHSFHIDCIDSWLSEHEKCPKCRKDINDLKND